MAKFLQTSEIAAKHGVTPDRITQIARTRGIEPAMKVGTSFLWSPAQARDLAPMKHGRPPKKKAGSKKSSAKKRAKK